MRVPEGYINAMLEWLWTHPGSSAAQQRFAAGAECSGICTKHSHWWWTEDSEGATWVSNMMCVFHAASRSDGCSMEIIETQITFEVFWLGSQNKVFGSEPDLALYSAPCTLNLVQWNPRTAGLPSGQTAKIRSTEWVILPHLVDVSNLISWRRGRDDHDRGQTRLMQMASFASNMCLQSKCALTGATDRRSVFYLKRLAVYHCLYVQMIVQAGFKHSVHATLKKRKVSGICWVVNAWKHQNSAVGKIWKSVRGERWGPQKILNTYAVGNVFVFWIKQALPTPIPAIRESTPLRRLSLSNHEQPFPQW